MVHTQVPQMSLDSQSEHAIAALRMCVTPSLTNLRTLKAVVLFKKEVVKLGKKIE